MSARKHSVYRTPAQTYEYRRSIPIRWWPDRPGKEKPVRRSEQRLVDAPVCHSVPLLQYRTQRAPAQHIGEVEGPKRRCPHRAFTPRSSWPRRQRRRRPTGKPLHQSCRIGVSLCGLSGVRRRQDSTSHSNKPSPVFLQSRPSSTDYRVRLTNFVLASLIYNFWRLTDYLIKVAIGKGVRAPPVLTAKTFANVLGQYLLRVG